MSQGRAWRFACVAVPGVIVGWLAVDLCVGALLPRLDPDPFFDRSLEEMRAAFDELHESQVCAFIADPPDPRSGFIVGLYGGSVARGLGDFITETRGRSAGLDALEDALGKPVVVLNLAVSGSHQPSQYNLVRASLPVVDAIVTVDGFNEQFTNTPDCSEAERYWSSASANPRAVLDVELGIFDRADDLLDSPLAPVASRFATWRLRARALSRELAVERADATITWAGALSGSSPGEQDSDGRTVEWAQCVRATSSAARREGVPYVALVQPNQYVEGSKVFSAEEAAVALQPPAGTNSAMRAVYANVTAIYDSLDGQVARLSSEGIHAASLRDLYATTREAVYTDGCCHVNDTGNRLMAEAVWAHLLEAVGTEPPAR